MAYTEPLMVLYPSSDGVITAAEVETAAELAEFLIPCNVSVLQFGAHVTEDFTAHAVDPVLTLGRKATTAGTVTNIASVTLSSASTSTLKSGDGVKELQTAITASTDLDAGDVILAWPGEFPVPVAGGEFLVLELTTASGSAGGAIIPFIIARADGVVDGRQTNVWTASVEQTVAS